MIPAAEKWSKIYRSLWLELFALKTWFLKDVFSGRDYYIKFITKLIAKNTSNSFVTKSCYGSDYGCILYGGKMVETCSVPFVSSVLQ